MDFQENLAKLRAGGRAAFAADANRLEYARSLDAQDPLRHMREEFTIPSKAAIRKRRLGEADPNNALSEPSVYFCGNSLGLQPKAVRRYIDAQLETWSSIGVQGHFVRMEGSPLAPWQDMAADCADKMAPLVGASPSEVVVMNSLTVNLHLMMASFYRPTETRHKIIAEWKPFPSDSYAFESQLQWHGRDVSSLVELQPDDNCYISTESILATIDAHAAETALVLLPGLQYYSGQLFDIPQITAYARQRGITVGWDLAHATGNVELKLHDWDVDFAVWCTYKYLNGGPGSMAGAFVHEKHGWVKETGGEAPGGSADGTVSVSSGRFSFRPRLSGWYGGDKSVRFDMAKTFQPTPGAQGFQVSNPSAIDLASLGGSLSVFAKTDIETLRSKSLVLTAYAEALLNGILADSPSSPPFRILTPSNPAERGAQLSVLLLQDGLLAEVGTALQGAGVILDQRKPNVIRIAPVPMYNTFEEVFSVINVLRRVVLKNKDA